MNMIKKTLMWAAAALLLPVAQVWAGVAKVGNDTVGYTEYDDITTAMNAWVGGTTLTLLADAEMTATKSFPSSDAARTLNLSTFTLTAPANKHAIQITNGGLTSTAYRLTINADKDNPGGITTSSSSYYAVYYSNTSKDRVGVIINGGVFNGGALYMRTGGNTKAGAVYLNGGTFNGGINLNRENTTINGGRYNGTFSVSVDSTCRLYICGGSFKTFPVQTWSADLPFKMALGSSIGLAVTAAQIEANPEKYPEFSGTYNYMNYSTSPATPMYPLDKNGQYMYATQTKFDRYVYRGSDSYYYVESTNDLPAKLEANYFSSSVAKTDITTVGSANFWKHVTDVTVPVYCVNVADAFALTGVKHGITIYSATDVSKTDFPGAGGNTFFINREGDVAYSGKIGFDNCYETVLTKDGNVNLYTAVLDESNVAASVVTFDSWGKGTTNNYATTSAAVAAMKKTGSSQTLIFYKDSADAITFTTAYSSTVLTIELKNGAKYTGTVSFGSKYNTVKTEDAANSKIVYTPGVKPENASIIVSGNGAPRYFEDSWDQFNAAMKSAQDGDTVKVLKTIYNLNLNTGDSYEINGNVTLDLTGHEIRFSSSEGLWLTGTGKLSITNGTVQANYCAIYMGTGSVTLDLTDVTAKSTYSSSYYARGPIAFAAATGCGNVVIRSGTYTGVGKKDFKNATAENTVIYGGTFQFDPSAYVAKDCEVQENTPQAGLWTVVKLMPDQVVVIPDEIKSIEVADAPTAEGTKIENVPTTNIAETVTKKIDQATAKVVVKKVEDLKTTAEEVAPVTGVSELSQDINAEVQKAIASGEIEVGAGETNKNTIVVAVQLTTIKVAEVSLEEVATQVVTKATFEVKPVVSVQVEKIDPAAGGEVKTNNYEIAVPAGTPITFRLPVDAATTAVKAEVFHEGDSLGYYDISEEDGNKFVEITASDFSEYGYNLLTKVTAESVAMVGEQGYATLAAALEAAKNGGTAELIKDITLTGEWTPVGTSAEPFKGSINGNDHTISGLTIATGTSNVGLLGVVANDGGAVTIQDLKLTDVNIAVEAGDCVGALIGFVDSKATALTVSDVTVEGSVSGARQVGGIIGKCYTTGVVALENLTNKANVTETIASATKSGYAGGICGYFHNFASLTATNCKNTGTVNNTCTTAYGNTNIGGLFGAVNAAHTVTLTACSNEGAVNDAATKEGAIYTIGQGNNHSIGGLVGYVMSNAGVTFSGCSNSGNVTAVTRQGVGGFVGSSQQCPIDLVGTNTNTGAISGYQFVGNFIGWMYGSSAVGYETLTPSGTLTAAKPVEGENQWTATYWYSGTTPVDSLEPPVIYVAKIGAQKYETLQAAIAAAGANDVVVLLKDITLTEAKLSKDSAIYIDHSLTLDLDGHTITVTADQTAEDVGEATAIVLTNADTPFAVTIKNGSLVTQNACNGIIARKNATLTLQDMVVDQNGMSEAEKYRHSAVTATEGAVITIESGVYTAEFYAVYNKANGGVITIKDGVFAVTEPTSAITDFESRYPAAVRADFATSDGNKTTINGGTFGTAGTLAGAIDAGGALDNTLIVNGGTFYGFCQSRFASPYTATATCKIAGGVFNDTLFKADGGHCGCYTISGGTFIEDVGASTHTNVKIADGYEAVKSSTIPAYWTVQPKPTVAKIGEAEYWSLANALKAAQSGDVIEIQDGTWGADAVGALTTAEAGVVRYKSLTIQPAEGATVTFTANVSLGYDDSSTANATMTVKNLNFENASLQLSNYVQSYVEGCTFTGSGAVAGALIIQDGCCTNHKTTEDYLASQVTVKNCTINGTTATGTPGIRIRNSGNVTLTGNTIANAKHNGILFESNTDVDNTVAKTVTVTGNTITEWNAGNAAESGRAIRAAMGTLAAGSVVTIEGNTFTKATMGLDTPDVIKMTEAAAATVSLENNNWNNLLNSEVSGNAALYTVNGATPAVATTVSTKTAVARIGSLKYETLAKAITAAAANDTITMIADHTLPAGLTSSKSFTLDLNGKTIDGADSYGWLIAGGDVVIDDLSEGKSGKITHCTKPHATSSQEGGAIKLSSGTLTLNGGSITNNVATGSIAQGGGVFINGGCTFTMNGGVISGNNGGKNGGGVASSGTFVMNGGTISGNTASYGGGIELSGGTFTMTDGTICNNRAASKHGGGINTENAQSILIQGGFITNNVAAYHGGGIMMLVKGTLTITDGVIAGNTAAVHGGGVYAAVPLTMTGGVIKGNESASRGGGLYTNAGATLTNVTIADNKAGIYAGGIQLSGNTTTLGEGVVISGNKAPNNYGGGVEIESGSSVLVVNGASFTGNTCSKGGAAIALIKGALDIVACNIDNTNVGGWSCGKGIWVGKADTPKMTISGGTFDADILMDGVNAETAITGGRFGAQVAIKPESTHNNVKPLTGGIFTVDAKTATESPNTGSTYSLIPEGKAFVENEDAETMGDYPWAVGLPIVAKIGTAKYTSLADALKAANSGDVIEIQTGTWGADKIGTLTTAEAGVVRYKSLTIQPAEGATVTFTANVSLGYDDSSTANATMTVKNLNFENASLQLSNYVQSYVEGCTFTGSGEDAGALIIQDSCCTNHKTEGDYLTSQVTVKDCTINGTTNAGTPGIRIRNSGNVTLTGNTVANAKHNGILFESNTSLDGTAAKTVTVTGNTITEWNAGNVAESGRAIRMSMGGLADGSVVTVEGNIFTKATMGLDTPDVIKMTEAGTATVSLEGNDWNNLLNSEVSGNAALYTVNGATPAVATTVSTKTAVARIGSLKYETLAKAIAAAVDNDVVVLLANTTLGDKITVSKKVTVKCLDAQFVIDANQKCGFEIASGADVSFVNVAVKNAVSTNEGAITVKGKLALDGCLFENNVGTGYGSAIAVQGGNGGELYATNTTFRGNSSSGGMGGAVIVTNGGTTHHSVFANCVFENNVGTGGSVNASALVVNAAKASIVNCRFKNCTGANQVIYCDNGATLAKVSGCVFEGNSVVNGVLYTASDTAAYVVDNCVFANNYASKRGAGLYASGPASARNCVFAGNKDHSNSAESVWVGAALFGEITNVVGCVCIGNKSYVFGSDETEFSGPTYVAACLWRADNNVAIDFGGNYWNGSKVPSALDNDYVPYVCEDVYLNSNVTFEEGIVKIAGVEATVGEQAIELDTPYSAASITAGEPAVTTKYVSLENAIKAVQNGQTIVVLANNDETFAAAPADGVTSFTINMGSYTPSGVVTAPADYKFVVNGDGTCTYQAKVYAVQIVETGARYEALAEALKAAKSGDVIEILAGTWGADAVGTLTTAEAGVVRYKSLTIQPAAGATVKFTSQVYLGYDDSSTANATMTVKNLNFENASLTLSNYVKAEVVGCTFKSAGGVAGALVIMDSCCTAHKTTDVYPASQVTVTGCTVNGTGTDKPGIRIRNSGNVTVTGNTIANSAHNGILFESNGSVDNTVAKTVTVTGNTITDWNAADATEGGRAIRAAMGTLAAGSVVTIEGNTFTKATLGKDVPDFIKVTEAAAATVSLEGNDWNNLLNGEVSGDATLYTVNGQTPTVATTVSTKTAVAKIGDMQYGTLAGAVAAAKPNDTIVMLSDVDFGDYGATALTIPADKTITLDLAGKQITGNTSHASTSQMILNKGSLTIADTVGNGRVMSGASKTWHYGDDYVYEGSYASNTIRNEGTLVVAGGAIQNAGTGYACYAVDSYNAANVTISGGTLYSAFASAVRMFYGSGTVTVSGGSITSESRYGVQVMGGTTSVGITGGTIASKNPSADYDYAVATYDASNASFTISGGTFGGQIGVGDSSIQISGGTFDYAVPEEYCAQGFIPKYDPNTGKYGVKVGAYVAQITVGETTTKFETLAEAIAAAADGQTVKLLKDCIASSVISGKAITLDLNGKVVTQDTSVYPYKLSVSAGAALTLTDTSTGVAHKFAVNETTGLWTLDEANGTKTVTGGVITGFSGSDGTVDVFGTLVMNAGNIVGNTATVRGGGVKVGGTDSIGGLFTMNGGTIQGNVGSTNGGGVFVYGGNAFALTDGTIAFNRAASAAGVSNGGTFEMTGGVIAGNVCTGDGGGVSNGGAFEMTGGVIRDNVASGGTARGAGVWNSGDFAFGGEAVIEHGSAKTGGAVGNVGTFTMAGGIIRNCEAESAGGVYNAVTDGAKGFFLLGGVISNCVANGASAYGGAVQNGGPMAMTGGLIADCRALGTQGCGSAIWSSQSGTNDLLVIAGGVIANCAAEGTTAHKDGGAIFLRNSRLVMTGGTVVNCTGAHGCGLYVRDDGTAGIDLSGSATIAGEVYVENFKTASVISDGYYGSVTSVTDSVTGFVTGGKYAVRPAAEYVAKGYAVVDYADSVYKFAVGVKVDGGGKTDATAVTEEQTSSVDTNAMATVVTDVEVRTGIEQSTEVIGVVLTTEATTNTQGIVITPAGVQSVIDEAIDTGSAEFKTALASASVVTVQVDVVVTPTQYTPTNTTSQTGSIAFNLEPVATVTVTTTNSTGTTSLSNKVDVTNEMIDQTRNIVVSIYTGFEPAQIVHTADNGDIIETFSADAILYKDGVSTVTISHFSTLTADKKAYVAYIGTNGYETVDAAIAAQRASSEPVRIIVTDPSVQAPTGYHFETDENDNKILVRDTLAGCHVEWDYATIDNRYVNGLTNEAKVVQGVSLPAAWGVTPDGKVTVTVSRGNTNVSQEDVDGAETDWTFNTDDLAPGVYTVKAAWKVGGVAETVTSTYKVVLLADGNWEFIAIDNTYTGSGEYPGLAEQGINLPAAWGEKPDGLVKVTVSSFDSESHEPICFEDNRPGSETKWTFNTVSLLPGVYTVTASWKVDGQDRSESVTYRISQLADGTYRFLVIDNRHTSDKSYTAKTKQELTLPASWGLKPSGDVILSVFDEDGSLVDARGVPADTKTWVLDTTSLIPGKYTVSVTWTDSTGTTTESVYYGVELLASGVCKLDIDNVHIAEKTRTAGDKEPIVLPGNWAKSVGDVALTITDADGDVIRKVFGPSDRGWLWDTVPLMPGSYRMTVDYGDGKSEEITYEIAAMAANDVADGTLDNLVESNGVRIAKNHSMNFNVLWAGAKNAVLSLDGRIIDDPKPDADGRWTWNTNGLGMAVYTFTNVVDGTSNEAKFFLDADFIKAIVDKGLVVTLTLDAYVQNFGPITNYSEKAISAPLMVMTNNNLKVWQNYVANLDGMIPLTPGCIPANVGSAEVTVVTPYGFDATNIVPRVETGVKVDYQLVQSATTNFTAATVFATTNAPVFKVDTSKIDAQSYWKIRAVFSGETKK